MAGHSKWANIKRRKAAVDSERGKLYTKLIREITVAARGGADVSMNPRLRLALEKAQLANMSKDVIERAIKRGAGGMEGENVEEVRYEGYGPAGVAVMVDCMTSNRNRTVADVRYVFSRNDGSLGTDGSVAYLFSKQGQIIYPPDVDEEQLMLTALELNALDVIVNDDKSIEVITEADHFMKVKDALVQAGFKETKAEITMLPHNYVSISDKETAEKIISLIESLEDLDDVQNVYANADITEDALKQIS